MRVKRLEIQGFKSFKDKVVIHFDHSITGIVGPNGCGKSNIVDAFFWVMGEQSYKHMRGSSSDDLIFNGSSKYAPLGFAEATLVLETEEVDSSVAPSGASTDPSKPPTQPTIKKEVSVTRRIYRGGEGEYFINGMPARLKDIQELFLDTGVGTKGYSIIEQGQIGKIVNSKPEERRALIEDAAGIAKYKARKKESIRKMEAAESNLSRLNDVIQEIERNLNSLERQAQKAQQYKKLKEELFDKEMTWGRRKALILRKKLAEIGDEKAALEQQLVGLRASLQTSELNSEQDRIKQADLNRSIESIAAKIQDYSDELTQVRSQIELSHKRREDLTRTIQAMSEEEQMLQEALGGDQNVIQKLEEEAKDLGGVFESAMIAASEATEKVSGLRLEVEEIRKTVESSQREMIQLVDRSSKLEAKIAGSESRVQSSIEQKIRIQAEIGSKNARLNEMQEEKAKLQERFQNLEFQYEEKLNQKTKLLNQIHESKNKIDYIEKRWADISKQLTLAESKVESLEALNRAYEGFADASRSILEWAKLDPSSPKAVRAFADLFQVKRGFESAAEGWFERALEDILVQDVTTALDALKRISDDQQGRARIHLTQAATVASKKLRESTTKDENLAREAARLAKVNWNGTLNECLEFVGDSFEGCDFIRSTLSNVAVVSDLSLLLNSSEAFELAIESGFSFVDLKGMALDSNGVLRGGSLSANESASLLSRKRLIAELKEECTNLQAELKSIENSVQTETEMLNFFESEFSEVQTALQQCEIQINVLKRDIAQLERSIEEMRLSVERDQNELDRLDTEMERANDEIKIFRDELTDYQARIQELEMLIQDREIALRQKESELIFEQQVLEEKKMNEAALRERSSSVKRELSASLQRIEDQKRRLSSVQSSLERARLEYDSYCGRDSDLQTRAEDLTVILASTREQMSVLKNELEIVTARVNQNFEDSKQLQRKIDDLNQKALASALELEKLNGEFNHLVLNLEEKYGKGCIENPVTSPIQEEMSEPVVTAEMTAEEEQVLFEEVEKLKDRIRRLGEVNVMAIEEFEELKKRHDYLLGERSDLERSIANLKEAIEHINKTSEQRFLNAFNAISERFERLFPIIFGGGSAKLSLIYPEGSTDVLEAGVDILAQPPGKKVSNINLLSGGEKALTALSLVFAIFMVKPSPFCVLDEVDAPLDDTNIGKFNALLREMSSRSQFIIVTHNKKTMELNDALYGVTMEEPGVSKMVSIELQ